mgnify:CR=1 FL=1
MRETVSKTKLHSSDRIPQTQNWIQDILTPSTFPAVSIVGMTGMDFGLAERI